MIDVTPAEIPGVRRVHAAQQADLRGRFVKTLHEEVFSAHGIPTRYAEQYYSVSKNNVLRGLHFQTPPHDHHKLVTCIEGRVFDVVVDLRKDSPAYGQHQSFELDGGDGVFVPSGCAHGFYVRSDSATLLYNVTTVYAASHDAGIRWDSVGIPWPCERPIVSERDTRLPPFASFVSPFRLAA
ncbi:MAG TPA: dTDP-4-dehydrorhamnose 3,5-epimerase family protein [Pseudolabrys sp.]|nr:dTDP-4-dehydrorhamnose 3,5-epimerase family protein [Pseudolabrys sp.]